MYDATHTIFVYVHRWLKIKDCTTTPLATSTMYLDVFGTEVYKIPIYHFAWMTMACSTWLGHPGTVLTDQPGHWGLLARHGGTIGVAEGCRVTADDEYERMNTIFICYTSYTSYTSYTVSYHIDCSLFMFILFSPLCGSLFSKPSRYCELQWLRCRAHQWMPRFQWRLEYLPSNWGG